jgi:hypothetical protein
MVEFVDRVSAKVAVASLHRGLVLLGRALALVVGRKFRTFEAAPSPGVLDFTRLSHALHQVRQQGSPSNLALSSRWTEAGKR